MILLNQVIELWVVALPGLWVTGYHRIMGFPPYTNSGTPKTYGLSQVMAYEGYGLRGCGSRRLAIRGAIRRPVRIARVVYVAGAQLTED